jgi:hypothetical protein
MKKHSENIIGNYKRLKSMFHYIITKRQELEGIMTQKMRMRKVLLVFWCFLFFFFMGCQGTGVVIEKGPSPGPSSETYEIGGGPPPWAPAHGYRAKHRYRYYPSSRVYYEKERGAYFYYKNGEWQVSVSLPSSIQIDVDNYVDLEMDTDRPYEWDHEVVKKYPPGQLKKKKKMKGKSKWE